MLFMRQQLSLCSSEIARRLSVIQTHFEECSATTSERQFDFVLEKFSFVSMVEKQFDSTGEWMISSLVGSFSFRFDGQRTI